MPVTSTDIQWWGSAVMPVDDSTLNIGGAIDVTKKPLFTRLGSLSTLEMLSSDAGDTTQTVTIYYLDAAGTLQSETKTLNGLSIVSFVASMLTFLRAVKSTTTTGTVTIRKSSAGATIVTQEAAVVLAQMPHYNPLIDQSVEKYYYEKVFVKNNHGSLALSSAQVILIADPQSCITFALESSLNGTGSNGASNNRQVAPAGFVFDATSKQVANSGVLTAGSAQGIWIKKTLAAAKSPFDDTYTLRLVGISA